MNISVKIIFRLIIIICSLLLTSAVYSQDIHFSQYISSPLIVNPALTGQFDGNVRLITNYKNQWSAISDNPFKTIAASVDAPVYKKIFFSGISFYNDKAGDSHMGINQVSISLASKVSLNHKNKITAGIQTGWSQRSINLNGVTWDNQYDGNSFNTSMPTGENASPNSFSFIDISAGMYWKSILNNLIEFNTGFAGSHLNTPEQSFYGNNTNLHTKWTIHGGLNIGKKNDNTTYIPSVMILKQGSANEINFGMMINRKIGMDSRYTGVNVSSDFVFGAFCRWRDALVLYSRFDYKSYFSIGLSYDINLSKLRTASYTRGGTEISMIYIFKKNTATLLIK